MLKNLASLGGAGAVRKSLAFDARPQSGLLETLIVSRASHQLNVSAESNSAAPNASFRHLMGPSVKGFDAETHIRKFRFTGKCPSLTVSKNLSNPAIAKAASVESKGDRPLSCPQKPPPPSSSLRSSIAQSLERSHTDVLEKRSSSVPPQQFSPFQRAKGVKSPGESAKNVDQVKSSSQDSSNFGREVNSKLRTPSTTVEKQISRNIFPTYNSRQKPSVSETESKNIRDLKKIQSTVENKASGVKQNTCKAGNEDSSKTLKTEPDIFDVGECKNTDSVISVSRNHNQRVSAVPNPSESLRSRSPKIQHKQNNALRQSSHIVNKSNINKISNDKTFSKNPSQNLAASPSNKKVSNNSPSEENTVLNKQSPTFIKSGAACTTKLFSPSTTSKSFTSRKVAPNKEKLTEDKISLNTSSKFGNIISEGGNTRKKNTTTFNIRRSFLEDEGSKLQHSTLSKQISDLKKFDSKNKFNTGVLNRFKNRQSTPNEIDYSSLQRHDLFRRPSFITGKYSSKRSVRPRIPEPSKTYGGSMNDAKMKSTSDMLRKPKVFYLGTDKDIYGVTTGNFKGEQPSDGQFPSTKSLLASHPFKSGSASRIRKPFANKSSKFLMSKRGNNKSENDPKEGIGGSSGSEPRDGDGHHKRGSPEKKVSSPFENAESCLSGNAANYLEGMFQVWRKTPKEVHPSWNNFFMLIAEGEKPVATPAPSQQIRNNSPETAPTTGKVPISSATTSTVSVSTPAAPRVGSVSTPPSPSAGSVSTPSQSAGSVSTLSAASRAGSVSTPSPSAGSALTPSAVPRAGSVSTPSASPGAGAVLTPAAMSAGSISTPASPRAGAVSTPASPNAGSVSNRSAAPSAGSVSTSSAAHNTNEGQLKTLQQVTLQNILHHYQMFGHLQAEVDPLERRGPALGTPFIKASDRKWPSSVAEMLREHKMTDLNDHFLVPLNSSIAKPDETTLPLGEILNRLQDAYCRYIGVEYTHITSPDKKKWIRDRFERSINSLTAVEKKKLWKRLMESSYFETFLSRKWPTSFRFSLEGCEILIPALQEIIDRCVESGTESIVLGMAHRGRLNVLANILNIEIEKLLLHFKPNASFGKIVGDVKYHLGGYVTQKHEGTNKHVTICIVSNASHLESVNPIVQGRCKAEQTILNDESGKKVVPIVVHGDAAYAGQGCVYENNVLSSIPEYKVQGTIHIVVNNNIGFTTLPEESRSALYCTDVAKIAQAPVFHVNSERPEDVMHCINAACAFRNQFQSDVVVDIVCYRRYGHNEADEPAYTSPTLYEHIRARKPWPEVYTQQLVKENVISQEDIEKEKNAYFTRCEDAFNKSQTNNAIDWKDWNDSPWKDFYTEKVTNLPLTGISEVTIRNVALKSVEIPNGFLIHKLLTRLYKARKQMIEKRSADWALAETIAYGSLLLEGVPIRLSGQDAQRGTFSHRHHVLHHQKKDHELYVPLNNLSNKQGKYEILNTPLIEYGALAFETGFAMSFANALTLYEGQYGDFINNAQLVFDAYLSSGESKWGRQCGLVVLAPHGMEGMGSEHSSARLERYLQMSSDDTHAMSHMNEPDFAFNQLKFANWFVANCTTPANFFHVIRRQIKLPFRKPLIIMTPKSLLRHPEVKSSFDEMKENTSFQSVIPDNGNKAPESVKKHIICSGRVYYDLVEARQKRNLESSIAITRIEQLAPFPFDLVLKEIQKYRFAEVCWVQEEHKNQGSWSYVFERLCALLEDTDWYAISYAGREVSPVTAVGSANLHNKEKEKFIEDAMAVTENLEGRGIKSDKNSKKIETK